MNDWIGYFDFENFEPSPSQVKKLRKSLEELLWLSPSDSTLKIKVRKTPALFYMNCIISSSYRQFAAEGVSENFNSALQIMESGINRDVLRWKKERFLDDEYESQPA